MVQYQEAGGVQGLIADAGEAGDYVTVQGVRYQRVEIDGDDGAEYLMDEENNIYDMNLNFVGQMGGDDEDA